MFGGMAIGHSRPSSPSLTHQERLQFPRPKEGILALRKRHDVTVKGGKPPEAPVGPSCTKAPGSGMWRELLECPDWGRGDTTGMGSGAKGQQHRGQSPEPGKAIFRLLVKRVRLGWRDSSELHSQGVKQSDRCSLCGTLQAPLSPGPLSPLARLR